MAMDNEHAPRPIPLASQVGGHLGMLSSEDGTLVIKPSLPAEHEFYQLVTARDARVAQLAPFVPRFYGMLTLQGRVANGTSAAVGPLDGGGGEVQLLPPSAEESRDKYANSLVLENISSTFLKPNIIDIKLGTVLYDETASREKKEKMLKRSRETTSFETGVRLTGFQVYDHTKAAAVKTPKTYGYSITAAELPDGIARFFPVCSSRTPYDQGLPRELLLPILAGLAADVRGIRDALAQTELRMVAGSLLIVYEADWNRAREGLRRVSEMSTRNCDEAVPEETMAEGSDGADDSEEEDDDEEEEEEQCPPYAVKLIDFAHARLTPGQGSDEGVLLGLDTTIKLLEGRISQIEDAQ